MEGSGGNSSNNNPEQQTSLMGGHAQYLKGVGEVFTASEVSTRSSHNANNMTFTGSCWKHQRLQSLGRLGSPRQGCRPCRNEEGGRTERSQPGIWPSGRMGWQVDRLRGNAEGGLCKCPSAKRLRRVHSFPPVVWSDGSALSLNV
jgi:hypothetical protein